MTVGKFSTSGQGIVLNLCQPQACKPSYVAKKRDWRNDAGWWGRVREQYRVRGTPTRWAKVTGIEKGSLSKYINGAVALGPENAFAISLAAGPVPRGLIDEDFARRHHGDPARARARRHTPSDG